MEALVSVIIPVYNLENYIEICLNSVVNQTYKNLEIICVDDGSCDKSAEKIKAIAEKDGRIKYFYQENGGLSAARNFGLEKVTGDYVLFVDADDCIHPEYVECEVNVATKTDADIVCTQRVMSYGSFPQMTFDEKKNPCIEILSTKELLEKNIDCAYIVIGNLYKHSLIKKMEFDESLRNGEDVEFMLRAMIKADKIALAEFAGGVAYYYFVRENSLSCCSVFTMNKTHLADSAAVSYEISRTTNDDFIKAVYLKNIYRVILRQRLQCRNSECEKAAKKKLNQIGRKYLRALRNNKVLRFYEKTVLILFFKFPFFYRFFRFSLNQKFVKKIYSEVFERKWSVS